MADQAPLWSYEGQMERPGQRPDGSYGEGILVSFVTKSGVHGTVWVTRESYSVEAVRDAINARAAVIEAVAALHG